MREFSATTPDARVAELAARQWGVVSRAQLRAQGLSNDAVRRRVRAGRLHRLHHGVYAVGHTVLRSEGRRLAAVLACGAGAVLSHRSAAAHWGLLPTGATRIDVTIPRTARAGDAKIRLHHSRSLIACDTTTHQGIPITSVARTLLDLAATVRADRLERALAQAEHLQLYDHIAIAELLARANGHRGRKALTEATALDPKLTRSEWEVRLLELVRAAALPEPLVNLALAAPTIRASRSTSAGRRTASSWRPMAGRVIGRAPPSRPTAAAMRLCKPTGGASSASPGARPTPSSEGACEPS
jgi:predicted transcriptional regulator of viral defense system